MSMNRYPRWVNLMVAAIVLFGGLYSMPNIFGQDPALQVAREKTGTVDPGLEVRVEEALTREGIAFTEAYLLEGRLQVRFPSGEEQRRAQTLLGDEDGAEYLGAGYVLALTFAPRTPGWVRKIGLEPMSLGLDLRGGVHFLYEVDMQSALAQNFENLASDFKTQLREAVIRYSRIRSSDDSVRITLQSQADLDAAERLVREADPLLVHTQRVEGEQYQLIVRMAPQQIKERQDFAIQQNITTIRSRIDELGVAQPVVQRAGLDRILVQIPGEDDPARIKTLISATSTLEFRLVDQENSPYEAERTGRAPLGSRLYRMRDTNQPILLNRDIIVSGDQLTDATSGWDPQNNVPAVNVRLDPRGARKMLETTKQNVGNRMAVVFIESQPKTVTRDGETERVFVKKEEVISDAVIRGVFSSRFQITGLSNAEAQNLALLLRAGSLAAPIHVVEERTIGPSLGQDNIDMGFKAVIIGFMLVVIFMGVYYRTFGLVANLALLMNLVLIVAVLSLVQAALTLPGIAGIVLTVGMAVDANVLIFERIREEIRNGNSPQASIHAGYEKALTTIADANITTFIAAVVLGTFGTGPIRGFAVTLAIGIATSMFTSIVGTRSVINLAYGGRKLERLTI